MTSMNSNVSIKRLFIIRRVWDFDTMMREKKAERRRPRRRRRDGSIDVGGAYDDQIKMLIDAMKAAAKVFFQF